jgi:hypothetical protein
VLYSPGPGVFESWEALMRGYMVKAGPSPLGLTGEYSPGPG